MKQGTERRKIYAVVGATSDVGRVMVGALKAAGHEVRPIARAAGISIDDASALKRALADVDGAFLMIPFDFQAEDLHARERDIGAKLAAAVAAASVHRVVLLSGLSAHLKTGSSLGAALMEERLDMLAIGQLVHLRARFFMENFLKGLNFAAQADTGLFRSPFKGDRPMPMISASDVATRAAELLIEEPSVPSVSKRVHELLGAADYTMEQATGILGAAIGKPDVQYAQLPYRDARVGMLDAGMSPSFADAVLETARSFNDEETWGLESRSALNTMPTTLEAWARSALGKGVLE